MKKIVLPNLIIETECPEDITMMVLGGRKPSAEWLSSLDFPKNIWAVDSGIESCFDSDIVPNKLVGDGDSASSEAWQWGIDNGVDVSKYGSEKDRTDFQLALELFSEKDGNKNKAIFLTGCFGGRFDHLWSTLITFLSAGKNARPLGMADEIEGMILLHGPGRLDLNFIKPPGAISLISFTTVSSGVSVEGVRWPLENVVLEYKDPYSISNRLSGGKKAGVSVTEGTVGVYWVWEV